MDKKLIEEIKKTNSKQLSDINEKLNEILGFIDYADGEIGKNDFNESKVWREFGVGIQRDLQNIMLKILEIQDAIEDEKEKSR